MSKEVQIKLSLYVEVKDREYSEKEVDELGRKILDELLNKDLSTIDSRIIPSEDVNFQLYETKLESV